MSLLALSPSLPLMYSQPEGNANAPGVPSVFESILASLPVEFRHPIPPPLLDEDVVVSERKYQLTTAHNLLEQQLCFLDELRHHPNKVELLRLLTNHLMIEYPGLLPRLTAFLQEINPRGVE
jgi:hypothetical protein